MFKKIKSLLMILLLATWPAMQAQKNQKPNTTIDALLCANDTFRIGDKEFTTPGVYTIKMKDKQGGDSIVNLNLKPARTDTVIINDFIVNETHYNKNGFTVDVKLGTLSFFSKTLKNEYGCDSTVTLILNSLTQPIPVYDTICKGESYTIHGETFGQTGEYKIVLGKYKGCDCDSSLQLHLFVAEPNDTTIYDTTSTAKGSYTANGFNIGELTAGASTYTETFKNQFGCDSTVTLSLYVSPDSAYSNHLYEEICENETFTYKDSAYKPGRTYILHETTATGADSIVYLHIKKLPTSTFHYYAAVFKGYDYQFYGFDLPVQEKVGVFYHKLTKTNRYGCDSVVTVQLKVVEPIDSTIIPTLFTPHTRDGKNDVFMKGYEVYIYDRYGNLVCHSKDGWDGSYRGETADPGVYIYTIILKDDRKKKGSIEVYK